MVSWTALSTASARTYFCDAAASGSIYARVCGATPGFDRTYPPEAEATAPLIKPSGGGLADAPTTTAGGGEPRWAVLPGWGDAERWYDLEAGTDWYDLRLSRTAKLSDTLSNK